MECTSCGAEVVPGGQSASVCPACLLRLALEPADAGAQPDEPEPPRILGPIGSGAHGTVYLGYRPYDEPRFVTVKVIGERIDVDRFSDRIRNVVDRLTAALPSDAPVLLGSGVTRDGHAYVLSTFVPGTPIAHYDKRGGKQGALRVAIYLCTLVADLHRAGIVHGSIKSSNVIVADTREGPEPVLLDTGVVPAIEAARIGTVQEVTPDVDHDIRGLMTLVTELLNRVGVRYQDLANGRPSAADLSTRLTKLRPV